MIRVEVAHSAEAIGAAAWRACLPHEVEGYDYHRAVELAGIEGFELLYVVVRDDDRVLAFAPLFVTAYRLDSTLQGFWKRVTEALARVAPALLTLRMVCLGSPAGEACAVGVAPQLDEPMRRCVLDHLMQALLRLSRERRAGLTAMKDVAQLDAELTAAAQRAGFHRLAGLPTASVRLPYASLDAYLGSLGAATRKDMRRKARAAADIVVDRRTCIDDVLPRIVELYAATRARSDLQFEVLPPAYFTRVLAEQQGRASCFLYWHDGRLLAFNLVLHDDKRLIDKFFGMKAEEGRRFNLYFLSWLNNVRFCIDNGIGLLVGGQAGYGPKLRLGCTLSPNWLFFRHRNRLIDALLRLVAGFLRVDRHDPVLSGLSEPRAPSAPAPRPARLMAERRIST
ncbi:MAG: GNAT family N-acetyltransferase [Alphaproteobacteria bacterium]|nr:GNAT family N-acetyltransferase [Alphaproteobacteria bacterium]